MALSSRMEQAKSILPRLFRRSTFRVLGELDVVRGYWAETVGPRLAERSEPVRAARGRLVVEVDSEPYLDLLSRMADEVVCCLRSELPDTSVRSIEFRLADVAPRPQEPVKP
ncbi:MAG: DciA family protein [Bryobacterales bacterium]|nr:DciA family protein [Bryobacterales bacterium]